MIAGPPASWRRSATGLTPDRSQGVLRMSGVGQRFPQFSLTGVVSNDATHAFQSFTQDSFPGKWRVVFFWPKDFTFVCPTEIAAFGRLEKEFRARDAQLLGASIDNEYVHLAWRRDRKSTRLNSSHSQISYAVFCLKKKTINYAYSDLHLSDPACLCLINC